ncbi:glycosyltransferase family 2 protein [Roseovarius pacificus]|uniref:glycosyltransferase family 2 protein n=1 Tax=Roseovarius pacificus TaxID=337701 RepID=UPI002A18BD9C|nr:glycosyltransferase family 2 protein [Roseovarius pacificus]
MQRVSIILPLYKSERYIRETVGSVLAQTHPHWELIVVDDGSPDNSGDICRSFKDPRVKVFTRENTGPCRSRNFGIAQATGDFIGFIDHDDIWLPEKLEKHLEHLNHRPEVGVSFGPSELIDLNGKPLGLFQIPKLTGINTRDILCRNPIGNGSVPIIRRELFEATKFEVEWNGWREVMYFDEDAALWEDVELWVRMMTMTTWKFEGIPECLTLYRIVPDGIAGTPDTKQAGFENGLERMRRYASELVEQHGAAARAYHLRYLARRLIETGDSKAAVSYMKQALKCFPWIFLEDPRRTLVTLGAAYALFLLPGSIYNPIQDTAVALLGRLQKRQVK